MLCIMYPVQWVLGALSLVVEQFGHQADHAHASSVKVKNEWSCVHILLICLHGMYGDTLTSPSLFIAVLFDVSPCVICNIVLSSSAVVGSINRSLFF